MCIYTLKTIQNVYIQNKNIKKLLFTTRTTILAEAKNGISAKITDNNIVKNRKSNILNFNSNNSNNIVKNINNIMARLSKKNSLNMSNNIFINIGLTLND